MEFLKKIYFTSKKFGLYPLSQDNPSFFYTDTVPGKSIYSRLPPLSEGFCEKNNIAGRFKIYMV